MLGEEEVSDVSLATFYVIDKENAAAAQSGVKVAWSEVADDVAAAAAEVAVAVAGAAADAAAGGAARGCGCGWAWCISRGGCHAC